MSLRAIVLYTSDPWKSAMPVLRIHSPARLAGVTVLQGNHGDQIYPELVSEAEVVVIQRDFPRFPDYAAVISRARAENKLVIYEVDDLIVEVPHDHISRSAFEPVLAKILRGIVEADAVITSTPVLREYLANFNPNIWLIPNLIDDAIWKLKSPPPVGQPEKSVVIGYMGGGSHLPDLEMVKPVLLRLLDDYGPGIEVRFWGVQPPGELLEHPSVAWFPLNILDYAEFADYLVQQKCDIFIAPLLDNLFNRCKSQIKFLEYAVMGVAGVYSRLEPYTSVITDHENGLLATTLEDWDACLRQMINSPDLRYRLSTNAQETLRRDWLLSDKYHQWLETYEQGILHPEKIKTSRSSTIQAILRITDQIEDYQQSLQEQIAKLGSLVGVKEMESIANIQRASDAEAKSVELEQGLANTQQRLLESEASLAQITERLNERDYQLAEIRTQLSEKEQQVAAITAKLSEKEHLLVETEQRTRELSEELNSTRMRVSELEQRLDESVRLLTTQIQSRDIQIEQIYQSTTWRIGSKISKAFRFIFPRKA
jgi:glycosyltransferase involved in cell wall biosynthesis